MCHDLGQWRIVEYRQLHFVRTKWIVCAKKMKQSDLLGMRLATLTGAERPDFNLVP